MLLLSSILSIFVQSGTADQIMISSKMVMEILPSIAPIATFSLAVMTFFTLRRIRIQAKYDRKVREMENLVAPLLANIKQNSGEEFIQIYSEIKKSEGLEPIWIINEKGIRFLDNILRNRHLGAPYLRRALNCFFDQDPYCAVHTPKPEYIAVEKILIEAIKRRYSELIDELEQLEKKLGSR